MGKGTNTVTTSPPPQILSKYMDMLQRGSNVSNRPFKAYSGEMVAPMSALEQQAQAGVGAAANAYQPYMQQAQNYAQQAANVNMQPQAWSPQAVQQYESPFQSDVINATMANLGNLNAEQLNQVAGTAGQTGAWGGDRAAVAQAEMARQQGLASGQTLAGLNQANFQQASQQFNTQQQLGMQGAQAQAQNLSNVANMYGNMGVASQNAALQGIMSEAQLGASGRAIQQAGDTANYQQFLNRQAYPFQAAQYYSNMLEGIGGQAGGITAYPTPSILSQISGTALSGLGLIGGTGGFGPQGWFKQMLGMNRGGGVTRRGYQGGGVPYSTGAIDPPSGVMPSAAMMYSMSPYSVPANLTAMAGTGGLPGQSAIAPITVGQKAGIRSPMSTGPFAAQLAYQQRFPGAGSTYDVLGAGSASGKAGLFGSGLITAPTAPTAPGTVDLGAETQKVAEELYRDTRPVNKDSEADNLLRTAQTVSANLSPLEPSMSEPVPPVSFRRGGIVPRTRGPNPSDVEGLVPRDALGGWIDDWMGGPHTFPTSVTYDTQAKGYRAEHPMVGRGNAFSTPTDALVDAKRRVADAALQVAKRASGGDVRVELPHLADGGDPSAAPRTPDDSGQYGGDQGGGAGFPTYSSRTPGLTGPDKWMMLASFGAGLAGTPGPIGQGIAAGVGRATDTMMQERRQEMEAQRMWMEAQQNLIQTQLIPGVGLVTVNKKTGQATVKPMEQLLGEGAAGVGGATSAGGGPLPAAPGAAEVGAGGGPPVAPVAPVTPGRPRTAYSPGEAPAGDKTTNMVDSGSLDPYVDIARDDPYVKRNNIRASDFTDPGYRQQQQANASELLREEGKAVATVPQSIQQVKDLDTSLRALGTKPGTLEEVRAKALAFYTSVMQQTGQHVDENIYNEIGQAQNAQKLSSQLVLGLSRSSFGAAREAYNTLLQVKSAVPNIENTPVAARMMVASIGANLQRQLDHYSFMQNYEKGTGGSLAQAEEAFNKYNPTAKYEARAFLNESDHPLSMQDYAVFKKELADPNLNDAGRTALIKGFNRAYGLADVGINPKTGKPNMVPLPIYERLQAAGLM